MTDAQQLFHAADKCMCQEHFKNPLTQGHTRAMHWLGVLYLSDTNAYWADTVMGTGLQCHLATKRQS